MIAAGADVDAKDKVRTLPIHTVLYALGDGACVGWCVHDLCVLPAQDGKSPMELEMSPALKQALTVSIVCCVLSCLCAVCAISTCSATII